MGEFKGFMKYEKQSLSELSLVERLKNHDAFQQRFSRDEASVQGARCMDCGTPFCQTGLLSVEKPLVALLVITFLSGMIWFIARISKSHINV